MARKDDLTVLIESILKLYFKIRVIEWYDDSTFYGSVRGKHNTYTYNTYTLHFGGNVNANYNFHYLGEPFHIMTKKGKK